MQKDDVLVEMAGKVISSDFNSLSNAIAGKKGGDPVTVVFYRGPEKKTGTMELSKRPMPDVPFDAVNLARQALNFTLSQDAAWYNQLRALPGFKFTPPNKSLPPPQPSPGGAARSQPLQ